MAKHGFRSRDWGFNFILLRTLVGFSLHVSPRNGEISNAEPRPQSRINHSYDARISERKRGETGVKSSYER